MSATVEGFNQVGRPLPRKEDRRLLTGNGRFLDDIAIPGALHVTLPWVNAEVERTRNVLGEDWWPYGVAKNRKTLETFLRYHYEQGLSKRLVTVDELFAPETLDEEYKI